MEKRELIGFTLAEVLITLAIIGVVAAMTIPTLVQNYQARSWNTSSTVFERKLAESLKIMHQQSSIDGYSTTKAFLNELSKYMQINKICDKLTDCFEPSIKVAEGQNLDITNISSSSALGHAEFNSTLQGVQFANGVSAIVAYNPNYSAGADVEVVKINGSGQGKDSTIAISTGAFSMVYDVNGVSKPNKNGDDVRGINTVLVKSSNCVEVGSYCIMTVGSAYNPIPCRAGTNAEYCGNVPSESTNDYWAGANKTCKDLGMRVPSYSELLDIYALGKTEEGLTPTSGAYWASDEGKNTSAHLAYNHAACGVNFASGTMDLCNGWAKTCKKNVMCVK